MRPAASLGACPDENELVMLAEGALAGDERRAIDRHLDGCAACSRLVAELARLAAPLRPAPPRYQIIRRLGEGAMGVVWEAEDTNLHRRVALKFVRPEGADSPEQRKRLHREARALAKVRHVNVISVFDAGEADDEVCLVLELVDGTNAREWRRAAPRTDDEILAVWRQAAAGVAAVHRAGIVHRDIKPDNVLVSVDGRVVVGDFGLATGDLGATTKKLTATGAVVGTPLYMSLEQLKGEPATAKSDQFALCASIWEALAGQRPYMASTIAAIVLAMTKPLTVPSGVDRRLFEVLARGMDPDPERRYPDVDALIAVMQPPERPSADHPTSWRVAPPAGRRTFRILMSIALAGITAVSTAIILRSC